MAHKLLKQIDKECKQKRAETIANHYKEIVGNIHTYFQVEN